MGPKGSIECMVLFRSWTETDAVISPSERGYPVLSKQNSFKLEFFSLS